MAESIIFDTHRFVKRMTDAGLAPPIAEALADEQAQLLERNLATKEDIANLRNETAKLIAEKSAEIIKWNAETKAEIIKWNAETKVEIIKWNVGTTLLFGSILVAAIKFL